MSHTLPPSSQPRAARRHRAPHLRWVATGSVALATLLVGTGVLVAGPVLHEFIEPDPTEDVSLGTTTPNGAMAAAIQTRTGAVPAPQPTPPSPVDPAYGGNSTPTSADAAYRLDSDTSQPDVVSYSDPFTPQIPPFKRLYAYDAVNSDLELVVSDPEVRPMDVGGSPWPQDDQFYADMQVDLVRNTAVRIPSVGPGARALVMYTIPERHLQLLEDSAENWFVRSQYDGRVRLIMHLSIDRRVFGSEFEDVEWDALTPHVPTMPQPVRDSALAVAEQVGVSQTSSPKQVTRHLIEYFRGFAPSKERPQTTGLGLYSDIALSRKGVCRHRSYAFVVTALGLGLPARLIRNEAHAWVEIYDTKRWHRVDLGGAAGRMEMDLEAKAQHAVPRDPYAWPEGAQSGRAMAQDARTGGGNPGASSASATTDDDQTPTPMPMTPTAEAEEQTADQSTETSATPLTGKVVRGGRVAVQGSALREGRPCAIARVDISLSTPSTGSIPIGTLVTDADGNYEGSLTVPLSLAAGDYEVEATVPSGSCAPNRR